MLNNAVLDVVIALVFMFYLAAILASAVVESLSNVMRKRAKYLLRGISDILDDPHAPGSGGKLAKFLACTGQTSIGKLANLVARKAQPSTERNLYKKTLETLTSKPKPKHLTVHQVFAHPLIVAFAQKQPDGTVTRLPAYLPSRTFATVLIDTLDSEDKPYDVARVRAAIGKLPKSRLKTALKALTNRAGDNADDFRESIQEWYDDAMDRTSGAYKRWAKRWLIVFSIAVAGFMHLDSVGLAKDLWTDEPARAAIVSAVAADGAAACLEKPTSDDRRECVDTAVEAVSSNGVPVGPSAWRELPEGVGGWVMLLLGIVGTAAAATMGAPFWFDALGRLNALRNTGPKPGG